MDNSLFVDLVKRAIARVEFNKANMIGVDDSDVLAFIQDKQTRQIAALYDVVRAIESDPSSKQITKAMVEQISLESYQQAFPLIADEMEVFFTAIQSFGSTNFSAEIYKKISETPAYNIGIKKHEFIDVYNEVWFS